MHKLVCVLCFIILLTIVIIGNPVPIFAATQHTAAPTKPVTQIIQTCSHAPTGYARCLAVAAEPIATKSANKVSTPLGYHPSDLQNAYHLPSSTAGRGQTVAIVDAYDNPNAESDLRVYRSQFGLPVCTTANGCFRKVSQNGSTRYPTTDGSWAQEISLDVDMVSAICPTCHILLVEASSNSFSNLGAAVDEAATLKATEISNSYGGGEYLNEIRDQSHYNHPSIAITASSGDSGYGVEFPAASPYVTAVGGTSLSRATNARGWSETAWNVAGSGCSAYISKSIWQKDKGCSRRTEADVSAVADPNTGVSVYDSYKYQNLRGWLVFGGTSVAAPIIASTYALAGNAKNVSYGSFAYTHTNSLFDVTTGSNGRCGTSYLCTAGRGYDGPTGNGTPNGVGAF